MSVGNHEKRIKKKKYQNYKNYGSGECNGLELCRIYWVHWKTLKAKLARKSRAVNKPATGLSWNPDFSFFFWWQQKYEKWKTSFWKEVNLESSSYALKKLKRPPAVEWTQGCRCQPFPDPSELPHAPYTRTPDTSCSTLCRCISTSGAQRLYIELLVFYRH